MKYAIVTGASSGIGFALAKELTKHEYTVFAVARRVEPMAPLEELGIITVACDVTKIEDVLRLKELVLSKSGGKLDLLCNNAGSSCTFPTTDVPDDAALKCYQVNVLAPVRLVREFSRSIIAAKGTIAFTGSISGMISFPFSSIYNSTKAAIHQYAETLHLEMKIFDVKVVNFVTGSVLTNIADTRSLPEDSIFNIPEGQLGLKLRRTMAADNYAESPEDYARDVVRDIMKSPNFEVHKYRGTLAWTMGWLIRRIVPHWIICFFLMRKFNLFAMKRAFKEQEQSKKKA